MGQQEIVDLFVKNKNEPLTIGQIAEKLGLNFSSVWRSVSSLLKYKDLIEVKKTIVIERKDFGTKEVVELKAYMLNETLYSNLIKLNNKRKNGNHKKKKEKRRKT